MYANLAAESHTKPYLTYKKSNPERNETKETNTQFSHSQNSI